MKTWLIIASVALAIITTPKQKQTTFVGQNNTHTAVIQPIKEQSAEYIAEPAKTAPEPPKIAQTGSSRDFIFFKESGGRLNAVNASSGACGLGQALPCSKLAKVCPNWQTDMACQLAFWDKYAIARYGSWDNAVAFWQVKRWW